MNIIWGWGAGGGRWGGPGIIAVGGDWTYLVIYKIAGGNGPGNKSKGQQTELSIFVNVLHTIDML
jgi:hypothetical protein